MLQYTANPIPMCPHSLCKNIWVNSPQRIRGYRFVSPLLIKNTRVHVYTTPKSELHVSSPQLFKVPFPYKQSLVLPAYSIVFTIIPEWSTRRAAPTNLDTFAHTIVRVREKARHFRRLFVVFYILFWLTTAGYPHHRGTNILLPLPRDPLIMPYLATALKLKFDHVSVA